MIGVTTYYVDGGQNLNFALPTDWIAELPKRGNLALAKQSPEHYTQMARNVLRKITNSAAQAQEQPRANYYDQYTYER